MRNLKEYRTRMGKTQKDVAAYLGIERSTYAKYENGSSEPTFETLRRLSEYFGASVNEMMGIARDEKAPAPTPSDERQLDEGQIMAAFWGGDQDLTEEDKKAMWADVKNFAAFVAQQKKQEKQRND